MGKISRFLRFLAIFGMFVVGTNAWSAGYVCDTMMVYDSCASGYYVSDCGDSADWSGQTLTESDLSVSNTCVACPDGYNCTGGLVCPVSTGGDGGDDNGGSDEPAEDIPYSCSMERSYSSCTSNYYLSDCGTSSNWTGQTLTTSDLSTGNSCEPCPEGFECSGGTTCPISTLVTSCSSGQYLSDCGTASNWNGQTLTPDSLESGNLCLTCPDGYSCTGGLTCPTKSSDESGYVCDTKRYLTCPSGQFLSDCGEASNWSGQTLSTSELSAGNACIECPAGGVCSGGATCPIIPDYKFELKTVAGTSSFDININAAGNFVIDWGDGNVEAVINETPTNKSVSHAYATAGTYTIKMGGLATEYDVEAITQDDVPVVSFTSSEIASIDGSIGAIFPTLSNGDQPGFFSTFANSKITSLPSTLFNGIHGAGESMFTETFSGCEALTKIPAELFSGITGAADHMFNGTFWGCTGLTEIPAGLFDGLADVETLPTHMFYQTFYGNASLTGPAARMSDGTFLHDIWPMTGSDMQTYTDAEGLDGWDYIPSSWGGGGVTISCDGGQYLPANATACVTCPAGNYCAGLTDVVPSDADQGIEQCPAGTYCAAASTEPTACPAGYTNTAAGLEKGVDCFGGYKFEIETTDDLTGDFSFPMVSVVGNFWVDWGDDSEPEYISLTDFTGKTITHNYATAGKRTIKFGGLATAYNTASVAWNSGVIKFQGNPYISKLSGSLGAIFPTLSDGSQPGFFIAFMNNTNLTEIPAELFDGISGQARPQMFVNTFAGCAKLTEIPVGLFDGITGAASAMFNATFGGCTSLTEIPAGLFSGVIGAAEGMFASTFASCTNLTSIPDGLFDGVAGVETLPDGTFSQTFHSNTSLTGPAAKMSAAKGGQFLHDIWPMTGATWETYTGATGLTDWDYIPLSWGGGGRMGCAAGQYIAKGESTCKACKPGYYCEGGDLTPSTTADVGLTQCPADSFCVEGSAEPTTCASVNDGLYPKSNAGATAATSCYLPLAPNQYVDLTAKVVKTGCPAGYYCPETTVTVNTTPVDGMKGATSCKNFGDMYTSDANTVVSVAEETAGAENVANIKQKMTDAGLDASVAKFGCYANVPAGSYKNGYWDTSTLETCPAGTWSGAHRSYLSIATTDAECNACPSGYTSGDATGLTQGADCFGGYKFELTTTAGTSEFGFIVGAKGNFWVDWGDDNVQPITKTETGTEPISHTYETAGTYTIKIGGLATGYDSLVTVISFMDSATKIASIDGSLGAIFPTLSDGSMSYFGPVFDGAVNLTSIPAGLFSGVSSAWFYRTFAGCTGLTSIPESLFSDLSVVDDNAFHSVFRGCSGLTSIPEKLFSGISDAVNYMFADTFRDCTGLTNIPENLFSGISGAASWMFRYTFHNTSITSIPAGLFSGVSGAAVGMFYGTFSNTNITSIPAGLFSGVSGAADHMFDGTFSGCTNLTSIPDGLFDGVAGTETLPEKMFYQTFYNNTSLTGSAAKMSAAKGGKYLHKIWPMTGATWETYTGTNIDDLTYIPTSWGGGGQTITCAAGKYLPANATVCATCTSTNYCEGGGALEPWPSADLGLSSCATATNNNYTLSDAGATNVNACYTNTSAGNSVETEGGAQTACPAGSYCEKPQRVQYGSVGGSEQCPAGSFCPAGSVTPTSCSTLGGGLYKNSDAGSDEDTDCHFTTTAGTYLVTKDDTKLTDCPVPDYCPATKLNWESVGGNLPCPDAATHKRTTYPANFTEFPNFTVSSAYNITWGTKKKSIGECRVTYTLKNDSGTFINTPYYNTESGKYDKDPSGNATGPIRYFTKVNPGYYVKDRYMDTYCNPKSDGSPSTNNMLFRDTYVCPAGSYCPGLTSMPKCTSGDYATTDQIGINSCATDTNGNYTLSAGGTSATSINACYLTLTPGKSVETENAAPVSCPAGGYCQGGANIYYGSTGGFMGCGDGKYNDQTGQSAASACKEITAGCYGTSATTACPAYCAANSWSNSGAASCTACDSDYSNSGNSAAAHAGESSCKVTCAAGTVVDTVNAACTVPTGAWYSAEHVVSQGETSGANKQSCPTATQYADKVVKYENAGKKSIDNCYARFEEPLANNSGEIEYVYCYLRGDSDYGIGTSGNKCWSHSKVLDCAAGYYMQKTASPTYDEIWFTNLNDALNNACVAVGAGYWSPADELTRNECPTGYVNGSATASAENQCKITVPAGNYVGSAGATYTACAKGYAKSTTETIAYGETTPVCAACVAGTYADATGMATCKNASAGYFVAGTAATSQTACAVGSYTNATGQTACIACGSAESEEENDEGTWGLTTSSVGQTSCNATCANATGVHGWTDTVWNSDNTVSNLCVPNACKGDSEVGAGDGYYKDGNSCVLCNTFADGLYPHSSRGGVTKGREACFLYTSEIPGHYIDAEDMTVATPCPLATYSAGNEEKVVHYGETSTCDTCPDDTYADEEGLAACKSCLTNYSTKGGGKKEAASACRIYCSGGSYLKTANATECVPVGSGNWAAGGYVSQGSISDTLSACPAGLTTIGYGVGADEEGDCGRILNISGDKMYLRSDKKTQLALNVMLDGTVYYGNMSTADKFMSDGVNKKLKLNLNDVTYSVYDDSAENYVGDTGVDITLDPNMAATTLVPTSVNEAPETWSATFSDGSVVSGKWGCSATTSTNGVLAADGFAPENAGPGCWCKITEPAEGNKWIYGSTLKTDALCSTNCSFLCANNMRGTSAKNITYRTNLYQSAGISVN